MFGLVQFMTDSLHLLPSQLLKSDNVVEKHQPSNHCSITVLHNTQILVSICTRINTSLTNQNQKVTVCLTALVTILSLCENKMYISRTYIYLTEINNIY